jgi:hypothetical protein
MKERITTFQRSNTFIFNYFQIKLGNQDILAVREDFNLSLRKNKINDIFLRKRARKIIPKKFGSSLEINIENINLPPSFDLRSFKDVN